MMNEELYLKLITLNAILAMLFVMCIMIGILYLSNYMFLIVVGGVGMGICAGFIAPMLYYHAPENYAPEIEDS